MSDAAQDAANAELLAEVPFLQLLDEKDREELAADLDLVRFPAGQVLFHYGDPGDSLYVIRLGFVRVTQQFPGGELVLAYLGRGQYFGEIGLIEAGPRLDLDKGNEAALLHHQIDLAVGCLEALGENAVALGHQKRGGAGFRRQSGAERRDPLGRGGFCEAGRRGAVNLRHRPLRS